MSYSSATVVRVQDLSPRLRRITLRVHDVEALDVKAAPDSAVGVYFPGGQGRTSTVRHCDGDLATVDVVLHGHGVATGWATGAVPGDRVGLDHTRSWYAPGPDTDWQLLVADLSGLPAAARIIENLPDDIPVTAIVEVAAAQDLDYLPARANVTLVSSIGTGNGHAPSDLARMVGGLEQPGGRGYCWFAGEAAESRAVRKHLRGAGWAIDQLDVTGYWRFDSQTWDARFAQVSEEVVAVWTRAVAEGKSHRAADEEFDEALERAGL